MEVDVTTEMVDINVNDNYTHGYIRDITRTALKPTTPGQVESVTIWTYTDGSMDLRVWVRRTSGTQLVVVPIIQGGQWLGHSLRAIMERIE